MEKVSIWRSTPHHSLGAKILGRANANERMTVTVRLISKSAGNKDMSPVSHDDFESIHGAEGTAVDKVSSFAVENGLVVLEASARKRQVVLSGTVADMEKAFGVELLRFGRYDETYRSHVGDVQVPTNIAPCIEAVLGLSDRAIARPHFRYLPKQSWFKSLANIFGSNNPEPMSPLRVAQLYDFPVSATGEGQTVGIIELGGGYRPADLHTYFSELGIVEPLVVEASILGAKNSPGSNADGEVMLDIEVVGAIANQANIVVYFTPNSSQGFLEGIVGASHDLVHKPSVISISWGGPEDTWSASDLNAMNTAIQDAVILGVTVTVAAGDSGSSDGEDDGKNHVDFPASSPYALACGGTQLIASNGTIVSETVWNDGEEGGATGGGLSAVFPVPGYQYGIVKHSVRGVPDVAGNASPASGYIVRVDGQNMPVGGTSAVALSGRG